MTKTMIIVLVAAIVFIVFCVLTIFALLKNHKVIASFEDRMDSADQKLRTAISNINTIREKVTELDVRISSLRNPVSEEPAEEVHRAPETEVIKEPIAGPVKAPDAEQREENAVPKEQIDLTVPGDEEEEIYLDDLFEKIDEVPGTLTENEVKEPDVLDDIEREVRELKNMLDGYWSTTRGAKSVKPQEDSEPIPESGTVGKSGKKYTVSDLELLIRE